jgi:hypothetical protein
MNRPCPNRQDNRYRDPKGPKAFRVFIKEKKLSKAVRRRAG